MVGSFTVPLYIASCQVSRGGGSCPEVGITHVHLVRTHRRRRFELEMQQCNIHQRRVGGSVEMSFVQDILACGKTGLTYGRVRSWLMLKSDAP